MFPDRINNPTKSDCEYVVKLVLIIDFLKSDYHSFSHINKELVKRGIIKEEDKGYMYECFTRVNRRVPLFEGIFIPGDQSPTGLDRWEYKIPKDMTKKKFIKRIENYVSKNFKTKFKLNLNGQKSLF